MTVTGTVDVTSTSFLFGTGVFRTQGSTSVSMAAGGGFVGVSGGKSWVNKGTLTIASDERILFGYASGGLNTLTNAAGGTIVLASSNVTPLDFYTGAASITNLGTLNLTVAGSHAISSSIAFDTSGTIHVDAGTLVLNRSLTSLGMFSIAPGARATIAGTFTNDAQATVRIGLLNATTNGLLSATGAATLAGTLDVYLTGGFVPDIGAVFDVITYSSHTGAFTILRGETPGGVMDFTVDTTTDPKVLKIRNVTVSTVLPGTDLVATDLALAPGSVVKSGATVTVQWTDANTGTLATTSSWADRLVVRNLGTNEVLVDMLVPYDAAASGPIAGGGSAARQATFVLPDGPRGAGAMSATVTLDIANDVAETNAQGTAELNNVATLPFTAALAPYPDLVVTDVVPTPGTGFLPGTAVYVAWKTRNLGDGIASGAWDETVRIRNLTTGQTLFTLHLPSFAIFPMAPGESSTTASVRSGPSTPAGWGGSSSPSPSTPPGSSSRTTRPARRRPITPRRSSSSPHPTSLSPPSPSTTSPRRAARRSPSPGQTSNAGTAQVTAGWFDRVVITNQTTGAQLANQLVGVDASSGNGTFPRSFVFRVPDGNAGAGTLRIQVTADANNTITEVNAAGNGESNNTATLDVTSTLALYPDLQVTDLTLTPGAGWQPSSAVIVGWKTRNQGNVTTAGSWVESVSVVNLTTGQTLFTQAVPYDAAAAGAIAAGAFADRSVLLTWPAGTSGLGQFRFTVTTDSTGQVFENNARGNAETNNTAQLTVLSAPDLRVANLAATAAQAAAP